MKKVCRAEACNFIKKETLAQVFSCEFCEISKNTFSYTTPLDDCFRKIFLHISRKFEISFHLHRGLYSKGKKTILL